MQHIVLPRPDDWHIHLRDGHMLSTTVAHCARYLGRGLVMPNLHAPITHTEMALDYRHRIMQQIPAGRSFTPYMTLYLTDETPAEEIRKAAQSPHILAIKLYPAGATTHSSAGVTGIKKCYPQLEVMEKTGMVLSIHGEVTDPDCDIFDREKVFIDRHLKDIIQTFPGLHIVLEHITTKEAVAYISSMSDHVAATITAHHLLINRNAMLVGGMQPHHYCLPVPKREGHRQALLHAACSGNSHFFLGSDSAPHRRGNKEACCGCAGIYTAHALMELCATAFEQVDALDKLAGFCSVFGTDFYGLPRNKDTIRLTEAPFPIPEAYPLDGDSLIPFNAGRNLNWSVQAA